jgi:hypothetical protein
MKRKRDVPGTVKYFAPYTSHRHLLDICDTCMVEKRREFVREERKDFFVKWIKNAIDAFFK